MKKKQRPNFKKSRIESWNKQVLNASKREIRRRSPKKSILQNNYIKKKLNRSFDGKIHNYKFKKCKKYSKTNINFYKRKEKKYVLEFNRTSKSNNKKVKLLNLQHQLHKIREQKCKN